MYGAKRRFNPTPVVDVATLGRVFIAWCTKNEDGKWEVGENYLHDGYAEDGNSIRLLEHIRTHENFDLDYEKNYYDNHYIMIVCTFFKGDKELQIFYSPEHLCRLLSRLAVGTWKGSALYNSTDTWPLQPQYSKAELENFEEWDDPLKVAHHFNLRG